MEERFGISISLHQDDSLVAPAVRFGEDPLLEAAAVAAENQKTAAAGVVAAKTRTGITAPAPKPKTIQHQSRTQAPKAVMMKTVRTGQSAADGAANAAAESGGVIMARTTKTTLKTTPKVHLKMPLMLPTAMRHLLKPMAVKHHPSHGAAAGKDRC